MQDEINQILKEIGLEPKNTSLYQTAFTHRSYLNESKEVKQSNERLEFLGDSVLSLIVATTLYQERPKDEEGILTNLRAYIVRTESLAKASRNLKLGNFLKLSRGEEISGGRDNTQILADTYEAFLGAVYLDLGIEAAKTFIQLTLLPIFKEEIEKGPPKDPKSYLQEVVQNKFQVSPKYRILETSGPDHAKQFTVGVFVDGKLTGQGKGSSKQQAEEGAASAALEQLTVNP